MSLRSLLRGSLLYTIGNFLPRIGAFLLLPIYTASMGPEAFGTFSLMLSISGVLGVVFRLGLDGALMRLHFAVEDGERPRLYGTSTLATLALGLVLALGLALASAPVFGSLFAGTPFLPYGPLTLLLTFLLSFHYVPFTFLRATQRPGRFVGLTFASFAVSVVATIVLVAVLELGATGALLGQIAGAATVAAAGFALVSQLGWRRPRRDLLDRALAFGLPLVPHGVSGWILNLSDRWLIGLLVGGDAGAAQAAVGVYSFGYVIGQVVALIAYSFNAAWVPFFYERGPTARGPALLRDATTLSTLVLAVLAVGIGLLAPELTALLAGERWGPETATAARITPIVALGSVAYGVYYMVVSAVFLTGRTRVLPVLTVTAGLVNVGLNIVLLPRVGIVGAAFATLAGYAALAAFTILAARRAYRLELDVPRLAGTLLGTAAILGGGTVLTAPLAGSVAGGVVHALVGLAAAVLGVLVGRGPWRSLRSGLAAGVREPVG